MSTDAKDTKLGTLQYEVAKPVRHKGKVYNEGDPISLTEDEAALLIRDGLVKSKA